MNKANNKKDKAFKDKNAAAVMDTDQIVEDTLREIGEEIKDGSEAIETTTRVRKKSKAKSRRRPKKIEKSTEPDAEKASKRPSGNDGQDQQDSAEDSEKGDAVSVDDLRNTSPDGESEVNIEKDNSIEELIADSIGDYAEADAIVVEEVITPEEAIAAEEASEQRDTEEAESISGDASEEDADQLDDVKERAEQVLQQHRTKKRAIALVLSLFVLLVLAYLGSAYYFSSRFYPLTKINGNEHGMKTVAEVEAFMSENVSGYTLTMEEIDGGTEMISGSDISIAYQQSDELNQLLKEQNPFLWFTAFWDEPDILASIGVEFDVEQLDTVIAELECMDEEQQTKSKSAYPEFSDREGEFVVVKEVIGTQVETEIFKEKVMEHINGLTEMMNMEAEECYIKPKYVSDSKEVLTAVDEMNSYLKAVITYDLKPQTEEVGPDQIAEWVSADKKLKVTFDEDGVKEFIYNLAVKYDTVGTTRTFTTADGNTVQVEGGNFGWRIDRDAEYTALLEDIKAGEEVTREPKYAMRGSTHGENNDYGNTYVEVNLTTQKLWFIQDGEIILESDIVTGKPSAGNATPQGSYRLSYKTQKAVLRGKKKADGTYEYESPVDYWMPFNGGIGFHDATWQSAFGGSRYLTHGSHGCVNMPYAKAQSLYSLIQDDTPIVLHY